MTDVFDRAEPTLSSLDPEPTSTSSAAMSSSLELVLTLCESLRFRLFFPWKWWWCSFEVLGDGLGEDLREDLGVACGEAEGDVVADAFGEGVIDVLWGGTDIVDVIDVLPCGTGILVSTFRCTSLQSFLQTRFWSETKTALKPFGRVICLLTRE